MRTRQLTPGQRRLVGDVVSRISDKLEVEFADAVDVDGPNIGILLRERGQAITIEVPMTLVEHGDADPAGREALRIRLKVRRDRMLFRAPPERLSKRVAATPAPSFGRPGGFGNGRGGRR